MSNMSLKQLESFLVSRYYLQESKSFIFKILESFPEFRYQDYAYRAIVLRGGEEMSFHKKHFLLNSWTKNLDGLLCFLDNCHREIDDICEVKIVEAEIQGLDLDKVIQHLSDHGISLNHEILQIHKEQEVLCTDYEDLKIVDKQVIYEDKICDLLEVTQYQLLSLTQKEEVSAHELHEVTQNLDQAYFFISNLGFNDLWAIKPTLDYLQSLNTPCDLSEVKIKLYNLGFLKG